MNSHRIGATQKLSLRVSVATLARVLFKDPGNDEMLLALERKATVHQNEIIIKSQPFGGAIRILDLNAIRDLIGDFHFDSEHSRSEQDFRLFIRPSDWSAVREFCIQHLSHEDDPFLETNPTRELAEEFHDALELNLKPKQYSYKPVATVVDDNPAPTENIQAKGIPTVRVYRIFEIIISDASLITIMLKNSESISHADLCELALKDFQNGGKGKASTVLTLPLNHVTEVYLAKSPKERKAPILFEQHQLDETVPAVLDDIPAPRYQKLHK